MSSWLVRPKDPVPAFWPGPLCCVLGQDPLWCDKRKQRTSTRKTQRKKLKKPPHKNNVLAFSRRLFGEQGWRSGESAPLPPLWPRFVSRTRRHMWVEFVVGSLLCS